MANKLDEIFSSLLTRREQQGRLRTLTVSPDSATGPVDFSSNGYLSLSSNAEIRRMYLEQLLRAESFSLGSGGSRLLDGNSPAMEALERRIAEFHGAEAGLLFNSGFEANEGLLSCGPQEGDVVVYDELIHASVHDGMRLGRAHKVPFAHNCIKNSEDGDGHEHDKKQSLDEVLRGLKDSDRKQKNVFVVVEGVYSMDGDVAPLEEIVACVEERLPSGNGHIIVDEAHSTGIFGHLGRGLVCEVGLENRIWARVHTFGKAMGCSGAIILCSPTTRHYLINYARSFIYTTAMSLPTLTSIQISYEFVSAGHAQPLLSHLRSLIRYTHRLLNLIVSRQSAPSHIIRINQRCPETPILPIFTSRAKSLARHCQEKGFMIRAIVAPTVPKGADRVRVCLHAGNSIEQIKGLCQAIEAWATAQIESISKRHNKL